MQKEAIVIGAGIGGMAIAIRLSCLGFKVRVFEKNDYPGGKLSYFEQGGYRFDAGPSLFTQPANIEELFLLTGEPIQEYFRYKRVPVACNYFFSNGKKVTAWADKQLFAAEMEQALGEPADNVLKYLDRSEDLYQNIGQLFLRHSLHKPRDFSVREVLNALGHLRIPYLFRSLNRYNVSGFKTPEAVQLFNRYATYNGSNPYSAPAMLSLIPHLEMNEGTFYPEGGMISITKALYQLAAKVGVQFSLGCAVEEIVTHGGKVSGVKAEGKLVQASLVVSNQDVYFTYRNLMGREDLAQRVLKQERSSSALIFYWGIASNFPDLHLHNIFFSGDYRQEFGSIFKEGTVGHDPTVYINITSKMEQGMAPAGKENWFVMVNVPANAGQPWEAIRYETRKKVLDKLSRRLGSDLEKLIETEAVLDPIGIETKTMSYMGSLYGTSSNSRMAAFMRHPNFSKLYKGLYFVGGSVHPGGGIPLCLRSAAITSSLISSDFSL